jgi:hypothetical protein
MRHDEEVGRPRNDPVGDTHRVPFPPEQLEQQIFVVRGRRVRLDADLARLYGVMPKRLNQQVKRNQARFPADFMFQLSVEEAQALLASRSQNATLKRGRSVKYAPYAFTEHGAVMLASVLNSPAAIEASLHVVRAFVRLRELLAGHQELAEKLDALEQKYDHQFKAVFEAIRQLMNPVPKSLGARIGFGRTGDK